MGKYTFALITPVNGRYTLAVLRHINTKTKLALPLGKSQPFVRR